ncbi:FAD-dependent oxidoreductase [Erwinia phyllosphaerae]|uniref:FAD-dependent oxidoreductase n=1 Tax=Erwinia phyllosphaerae TaxID=2853256 RepID=UPI001FF02D74|nr:FAD-dependent oxidoreductase [Erwinia phyllosphaerae]MBV4368151.1 FAD-dependent oxidoreductase [Erwinia phyllosphaerae]
MNSDRHRSPSSCCIVGAGPAGLMLGYLLARNGIPVTVLEKHGDFLRDFRGDTIHPSTLEIIWRLGFLEEFLALPHQKAEKLYGEIDGQTATMADFSRLPTRCKYIAFMPQWDFLNFLSAKALQLPNFRLIQNARVQELVEEQGQVKGVKAIIDEQLQEIRSDLVIACDGRHSVVRELAGLPLRRFGSPRDVLWLKVAKQPEDPEWTPGHRGPKKHFIMIDRGDYWQCGYSIPQGSLATLQTAGLSAFLQQVAAASPFSVIRLQQEITNWQQVKLLKIRIDRLQQWAKPGLLCIGDAAHAMSPIGGVGVNLAIQDAVAAANILSAPLQKGTLSLKTLQKVQRRRAFATWATQSLQIMISKAGQKPRSKPPGKMELWLRRRSFLPFLFGRLIGMGFYREIPKGL